jgi:hypothetical protein
MNGKDGVEPGANLREIGVSFQEKNLTLRRGGQ